MASALQILLIWILFIPMAIAKSSIPEIADLITQFSQGNYSYKLAHTYNLEVSGTKNKVQLKLKKYSLKALHKLKPISEKYVLARIFSESKYKRRKWPQEFLHWIDQERDSHLKYTTLFFVADAQNEDSVLGVMTSTQIPYGVFRYGSKIHYGDFGPLTEENRFPKGKFSSKELCEKLWKQVKNIPLTMLTMEKFFSLEQQPEMFRTHEQFEELGPDECEMTGGFVLEPGMWVVDETLHPSLHENVDNLLNLSLFESITSAIKRNMQFGYRILTFNNLTRLYKRRGFIVQNKLQKKLKKKNGMDWKRI